MQRRNESSPKKREFKVDKPVEEEIIVDERQDVKEEGMLIPTDDYLSAGVHIGSKARTKRMAEYIFKVRPDGLAILNVEKINDKLKTVCEYLAKFSPEEILVICKRANGDKPIKMLTHSTGIKSIIGRYLPGTLTNPNNEVFMEPKVVLITDMWYDKQALIDAFKSGAIVIALCNSNNIPNNVDMLIPCNNKGGKSLSLIYWIIAKEYAKARNIPFEYPKEKFV